MDTELLQSEVRDFADILRRRKEVYREALTRGLLDDSLFKRSQGGVYTLDAGSGGLALDNTEVEGAEVDETKATATFTITTTGDDRYGDIVVSNGCRYENYARNPVVFFGHKQNGFPIGQAKALHPDAPLDLQLYNDCIKSTVHFHLKTAESEAVFALTAAGVLRAASIGFLPIKASLIKRPDDDEEGPRKTADGERLIDFSPWMPLRFLEWELLEWSVVSVPANAECLQEALSRGSFNGVKFTDSLCKALEPFKLKARIWSPGFDPAKSGYSGQLAMGESVLEYEAGKLKTIDGVSVLPASQDPAQTLLEAVVGSEPAAKEVTDPVVSKDIVGADVLQPVNSPDDLEESETEDHMEEEMKLLHEIKSALDEQCKCIMECNEKILGQLGELSQKIDSCRSLAEESSRRLDAVEESNVRKQNEILTQQVHNLAKNHLQLSQKFTQILGRRV